VPVTSPVLEVRQLAKRYGPVRAVDGVSLSVAAGEIYALLGLNGAGKTTMIRCALGMVKPDGGSVNLFGSPVAASRREVWERIGYLVETPAAYPELTARENLGITARLKRLPVAAVDAVLAQAGLGRYADRRAGDLSLGNKQRLGLAKALIGQPGLLILDEPANGLDPAGVTEIRELLKSLAAQGTAILLSSHILAEVTKLASRIGILHAGSMVTEFTTASLPQRTKRALRIRCRDQAAGTNVLRDNGYSVYSHDDGSLTITTERALAHPEEVATALVNGGCPPWQLKVEEEDLEAFFLRLTMTGAGR
jgi:ABC-2 type transport system ATP-binding protein